MALSLIPSTPPLHRSQGRCYVSAMLRRIPLTFGLLALLLSISCESSDPRLPQSLYDEAVKINQQGRNLEAKSMMEMITQQFPETQVAQQSRKDVYLLEVLIKQDNQERLKELKKSLRRVADALTRYKGKHKEYPGNLGALVPEYLDRTPGTAWGHPFLYRPYVKNPIVEVKGKRGLYTQKFNTEYDGYLLACLGTDLLPGGEGMAADILIVDGEPSQEPNPPMIPLPQPAR